MSPVSCDGNESIQNGRAITDGIQSLNRQPVAGDHDKTARGKVAKALTEGLKVFDGHKLGLCS
jgi:hypothetical protein